MCHKDTGYGHGHLENMDTRGSVVGVQEGPGMLEAVRLLPLLGKSGRHEDRSRLHPLWGIFPPTEEPPALTLLCEQQASWQPKWVVVHAMQNSRKEKMSSMLETAIPGVWNQNE